MAVPELYRRAWPARAANPAALLLLALGLLAVAGLACALVGAWPEPAGLRSHHAALQALGAERPWSAGACFFCVFTLMSALALPGCGLLALAAGACFGVVGGTALVLVASTLGATLSFLAARHWWRDAVRRRWGHRLAKIEAGLARDGALYLFTLRVAPVIPFALLNPLMGLSAMPTRQFFAISLVGMAAGSAAYVYAGSTLAGATGGAGVGSAPVLGALLALSVLPWLARALWRARQLRGLRRQRLARQARQVAA